MEQTTLGSGQTRITTLIGRAAEDLSEGSISLKVMVPQLNPAATGAVKPTTSKSLIETRTSDGVVENAWAETTNTITATYLGLSNIKYPPTVRTGEQVMLYQFGDSDAYYWQSLGRDPELRRLDTWRVEVSNKTETTGELTDDNTYFIEMDTKTSTLTIKTSKSNGEVARYTLRIDGKSGELLLGDDKGNSFFIDSKKPQVRMANADGAMVNLDKKDAYLVAPQDVVLKAGRQCIIDAPVMTQRASGGGVCEFTTGAMAINADVAITLNAPVVGIGGQLQGGSSATFGGPVLATAFANGAGPTAPAASNDIVSGSSSSPEVPAADPSAELGARHSAASEQLIELATLVAALFDEVTASVGVPADTTGIVPIAVSSEMPNNTGT